MQPSCQRLPLEGTITITITITSAETIVRRNVIQGETSEEVDNITVEGDAPIGNISSASGEEDGNAMGGKGGKALSSSTGNRVREGGRESEVTIGVCRHICLKGGSCRCRE